MGAFSGNITNVMMGGVMGTLPSQVNLFAQAGLFGYSVARNGPNALAGFAAGFAGGMAGGVAGSAFGNYLNAGSVQVLGESIDNASSLSDNLKYQTYQPDPKTALWEIAFLQRVIFAEAAGDYDDPDSMAAVAWVVRNRVDASFGDGWDDCDTYQDAILSHGQFTSVGGGPRSLWNMFANPESLAPANLAAYNEALAVGQQVYEGSIADPTGGATFFHRWGGQPAGPGQQVFGGNIFY